MFNEAYISETKNIEERLIECENVEELEKRVLPLIKTQREQWAEKINYILDTCGYTKSKFAQMCKVSRVTLGKWVKGAIPRQRETFLRIGLAAAYDREDINVLLQRYGHYPELYSKSLEDCVAIYVINNIAIENRIEKYDEILYRIKSRFLFFKEDGNRNEHTKVIDVRLKGVASEEELEKFIEENSYLFGCSYNNFYSYVKMNIESNYSYSVFELAEGQGWSSSLRQCVSAIRQRKWYPTRNKIISLGLHLSMDYEQINHMLGLAHMEPLCANNILESVIIYILESARDNNILDNKSDNYDPDELCRYAKELLKNINYPEIESFISELPEMDDEW